MPDINFAWWNLQNFFDTDDDPISNDFAFGNSDFYTETVFNAKKANLATGLEMIWPNEGIDLLTVCEIEKDSLLQSLVDLVANSNLQVVEDPSGTNDLRGIDVAMAFNPNKLTVVSVESHLVHLRYRTRDLFEVVFRVNQTGEEFTVIACHWPSRSQGRYESEPLRIAVAEHVAYLVEDHLKVTPEEYNNLKSSNNLQPVVDKWESKVIVVGDLNDEPFDRSIVQNLKATWDLERVKGATNDIDGFKDQVSKYRGQDIFLYNISAAALRDPIGGTGTYFLDGLRGGGKMSNRYQILDQLIVTRGLLSGNGLTADLNTFEIIADEPLATSSKRPKKFTFKKDLNDPDPKGFSDHLPLKIKLNF